MKENLSFGEKEKKENTRGNNLESLKIKAVRAAKKALIMASILGGSNALASPKEEADKAFFDSKKESVELTQEDIKVCEGEFSHFLEEFDNELEGGKESKTNKKEKIKSKPMFESVDENNFTHEYWTSGYVPQEKLRRYIGNHPELYKKIIDGEIKMPERSLLSMKKMLGPIIPAILKYAEDHDLKPKFNTDTYLKEYASTPTRYTTNLYTGDRKVAGYREFSGASLDTNWSYENSYGTSLNDVSTHEILGHGKSSDRGAISNSYAGPEKEEADAEQFLSSYKSKEKGEMKVEYNYGIPRTSTNIPPIFRLKQMHTYFKQWIRGVTGIQEKEKIENIYNHFVKEGGFQEALLKYAYDINNIKKEDVERFYLGIREIRSLASEIKNKFYELFRSIYSQAPSESDWEEDIFQEYDVFQDPKYSNTVKNILSASKELKTKFENIKKFHKEIVRKSPYENIKNQEIDKNYALGDLDRENLFGMNEQIVSYVVKSIIEKAKKERRWMYSLEKRFPGTKQSMEGYTNFEHEFFYPDLVNAGGFGRVKEVEKEVIPVNKVLSEISLLTYEDENQSYKKEDWSPEEYYKKAVEYALSEGVKKEDIEKQIPYYALDFTVLEDGEKDREVIGVEYKVKEGLKLFQAEQEFKKQQLEKEGKSKEK